MLTKEEMLDLVGVHAALAAQMQDAAALDDIGLMDVHAGSVQD